MLFFTQQVPLESLVYQQYQVSISVDAQAGLANLHLDCPIAATAAQTLGVAFSMVLHEVHSRWIQLKFSPTLHQPKLQQLNFFEVCAACVAKEYTIGWPSAAFILYLFVDLKTQL